MQYTPLTSFCTKSLPGNQTILCMERNQLEKVCQDLVNAATNRWGQHLGEAHPAALHVNGLILMQKVA